MKKILYISSVGGHLTQLMQLKPLMEKYDYHIVTEKTDITRAMRNDHNVSYLVYGARNYLIR